jgi:prepilin-type N-terminal cleavage/methylation domain-containing protein
LRGGFTIPEVLLGLSILALLSSVSLSGFNILNRQSRSAFDSLGQLQEAELLLENIRLELSSIVLNPFADAREHEGNSILISKPNGTSIQFVIEKQERGGRQRYLVYYEGGNMPGGGPGTRLRKKVWKFERSAPWLDPIQFPPGWPANWIGALVEDQDEKYRNLNLVDIKWRYLVPGENEGRVFVRLNILLKPHDGAALIPLSTLVGITTPDPPATISDCPCLFHPDFDPTKRDCTFCIGGTR